MLGKQGEHVRKKGSLCASIDVPERTIKHTFITISRGTLTLMMKTGAVNGLRRIRAARDASRVQSFLARAVKTGEISSASARDSWSGCLGREGRGSEGMEMCLDAASEVFSCSGQKLRCWLIS